jgi:hypothetical protein
VQGYLPGSRQASLFSTRSELQAIEKLKKFKEFEVRRKGLGAVR